ncbi:MAG: hypothetical protein WA749_04705 [Gelidibacter sp.]
MNEFLIQNFFVLSYSIEFLAAITGLFYLKKFKSTAAESFIYFLIYAFLVDLLGGYPRYFRILGLFEMLKGTVLERNYLWYTVFWGMGSALFYVFFYNKILKNDHRKRILNYAAVLFLIVAVLQLIFNYQSNSPQYRILIFVMGSLLILLCVSFYFIEILENEKVLTFYKSIYFWISAIILIWFLVTTPLLFYEIYFSTADWNFILLKWQIYLFANMFMYLSFSFALLWCKPEND